MRKVDKIQWHHADDVKKELKKIVAKLKLDYIDTDRIICFRSVNSSSRARARIWSFPRVWQLALNQRAHYIIEVLSQHYDKLSDDDKSRILIHELLHIPSNFSGSLLPHRGRGRRIDSRRVEKLLVHYKNDID